ncbi:MAG: hypothetical protein K2I30_02590 [Clostridia bacterium]|nr:hypothetical protein [Clostridia bacterium]
MTIHHDKLAYGKLASEVEELSEDKIAQMLKELSEAEQQDAEKEQPGKNGNLKEENRKEE